MREVPPSRAVRESTPARRGGGLGVGVEGIGRAAADVRVIETQETESRRAACATSLETSIHRSRGSNECVGMFPATIRTFTSALSQDDGAFFVLE